MDSGMENAFKIQEGVYIMSETNIYRVNKILKQRNFGDLIQCIHIETGEIFAVKCIREKFADKYKQEAEVLQYVSQLNSDDNCLLTFRESFIYQGWTFFAFEKLDLTLIEFMRQRNWKPLDLEDIRIIAYQMLLALKALKQTGITHTSITPDNIMLVNHKLFPFKVRLTGFGNASLTFTLPLHDIPQICGYAAPEILLDCPLDESLDVWSLGSTLAFLFLGFPMYPTHDEYSYMKTIVQHFGQPDESLLNKGWRTKHFFKPGSSWTFKTMEEYVQTTGKEINTSYHGYKELVSLDSLINSEPQVQGQIQLEDRKEFVDLLKKMLRVNPKDRIFPADALVHPFFKAGNRSNASNSPYATIVNEITTGGDYRTPDNVLSQDLKDSEMGIQESTDLSSDEDIERIVTLTKGDVIRSSLNVYCVEKKLGSGAFGQVVMCRIEGTETLVAIKLMSEEDEATQEMDAMRYLMDHDSTQKFITKFIEGFEYNNCFYLVFELLDRSLQDLMEDRDGEPLKLSEIRIIAEQLLETLNFLQHIGVTHTDIKTDNVMLINHDSQPFRVKLIDYGLAVKTSQLSENDVKQASAYRAPEIHLGIPCDESLDTWGLGYVLAFLFLGGTLCPRDEYEAVRIMVKLLGMPDSYFLSTGWQAKRFFTLDQSGPEHVWRLKTPEEYEKFTGNKIEKSDPIYDDLDSLDDLVNTVSETEYPAEVEDLKAFVDLLKKMLSVNPGDRIHPEDALNHSFITLEHLTEARNTTYVTRDHETTTRGEDRNPDNFLKDSDTEIKESFNEEIETTVILKKGDVLRSSSNVYYVEKHLGSGGFGQVFMCRIEGTDELVAIKLMLEEDEAMHEMDALKFVKDRETTQQNIIKFIEGFNYNNYYCLVFELLDRSLHDLMKDRHWIPLKVSEIRLIAKQLLETLDFLQNIGVTHTDIKPDNVMLVNSDSQPFRVKLIDFGFALKTSQLSEYDLIQVIPYRAPEIHLGVPREESLDTWGLGYVLAFLFISRDLCPNDEYEAVRILVKLLGLPDSYSLSTGWQSKRFFTLDQSGSEYVWRLKTPEEYEQYTGNKIKKCGLFFDTLDSLDDLVKRVPETADPAEVEDLKAFVDILKQMLSVNPGDRILPSDALNHTFITMEHLTEANSAYVTMAHEIMTGGEDKNSNSAAPTGETSDIPNSADESSDISSFQPHEEAVEETSKAICLQEQSQDKLTEDAGTDVGRNTNIIDTDVPTLENNDPHCVEVETKESALTKIGKFFYRMWNQFTDLVE